MRRLRGTPEARRAKAWSGALAMVLLVALPLGGGCAESARAIPPPLVDEAAPAASANGAPRTETAVLSGGCFWGVQKVFQHVKGVRQAVSGYAGGTRESADYDTVSTGATGHAESVRLTFDPGVVSYGTILRIFFSVAHDPTQRNRQGPDTGTQYRSEVFTLSEQQRRVALEYVRQLDQAGVFDRPIATRIEALQGFYPAEAYHQDFATLHPDSRYIALYDLPKVRMLETMFPQQYRPEPVLVSAPAVPGSDGSAY